MFDLIVVGGGPAGVTAALRACELGASTALVERSNLGGTCTNDGCVPTRVLAKAARLAREARHAGDYGLILPEPEVDFEKALARAQQVVYQIHEKKQLLKSLQEAGVQVYEGAGPARFSDPHTLVLGDGSTITGAKFILAVGGHPRRLNFPGSEHALTHSDVWRLRHLPRSVAIIGGSSTGCQLASIFASFGSQVWVLETAPALLFREDQHLSTSIEEAFSARGIHVTCGIAGVQRIEQLPSGLALHYSPVEGQHTALEVEAVIMAVGWPGNLDDLSLDAAGVQTDRGYIPVDSTFQTSTPHIYAAGDITGRMMLVQTANNEALAAVENAVLGSCLHQDHQVVPHGGFTDPEYGSVGLTEEQARQQGEVAVAVVNFSETDRAVIDGHTEGFCKLIASPDGQRLLGAHVVGEQALETVHLVAAGMASGMRLEQLASLEIAYPTYVAIIGLAARRLAYSLGLAPLSAEWRALGKHVTAEWETKNN